MSDLSMLDDPETAGQDTQAPFSQEALDEARAMLKLGLGMLTGYCERNRVDLTRWKVIDRERKVIVPNFTARGKISNRWCRAVVMDLVFEDLQDGGLWIADHKAFSASGYSDTKSTVMIDPQGISYWHAAKILYGKSPNGFLWNVALKSVPREPEALKTGGLSVAKSQAGTTPELYRAALAKLGLKETDAPKSKGSFSTYGDFIRYLEATRKDFFPRTRLAYTPPQIQKYEEELAWLETRILKERPVKTVNRMVCPHCDFYQLCLNDSPEARDNFTVRDRTVGPVELPKVPDGQPGVSASLPVSTLRDGLERQASSKKTYGKGQPRFVMLGDQVFEIVGMPNGIGKRRIMSNSRAQSFLICRAQHNYSYNEGLRPKRTAIYLDFGSWWHEAIARWYGMPNAKGEVFTGNDEAARSAFESAWSLNFIKRFGVDPHNADAGLAGDPAGAAQQTSEEKRGF